MTQTLTGGCACGAVRYRLASAPMFVNCCHCTWCQRETGSAFVINAIIESDRVELIEGETLAVATASESGAPQIIHRCPACYVALWSHYGGRTRTAFVRAGTLDKPNPIRPDAHIFTRSKLSWVSLEGDIPAFEIFYDLASQWLADSLARRKAALAGG